MVAAHHVVDLDGDVALEVRGELAALDIFICFAERHGDAALVDDAAVFLLDLKEHGGVGIGCAVGAQAELFFVGRLSQRGLDQLVVGVIEVDVADLGLAVFVDLHIGGDRLDQGFILLLGEHVFLFNSFEDISKSHGDSPFLWAVVDSFEIATSLTSVSRIRNDYL